MCRHHPFTKRNELELVIKEKYDNWIEALYDYDIDTFKTLIENKQKDTTAFVNTRTLLSCIFSSSYSDKELEDILQTFYNQRMEIYYTDIDNLLESGVYHTYEEFKKILYEIFKIDFKDFMSKFSIYDMSKENIFIPKNNN